MRRDPHSYCDDTQPEIASLDWQVRVDFEARRLDGAVTLELTAPAAAAGPIDLDTRELDVHRVHAGEAALAWELAAPEPILGARLRVELPAGTQRFTVEYRTTPGASALQWLEPAQTAGGVQPFLFSQCQAIHARSVLPVQDTPRVRVRFTAALDVPVALRGLMAAAFVEREEDDPDSARAIERWHMPQPIPPYLLAFAVGHLRSADVGPRCRVWAEPEVLERAAWEFAGTEAMLEAAEKLFGPYDWERFDILTMPPSFPYGGMENPRLTFLTPTLLAGDRSLVNVVAHELAHSWTGNLVSSASAEHFWLNEGFTVFAERRIVEALAGSEVAIMQAALGRQELDRAVAGFATQPDLTRLHVHLSGVDPDEAFSIVPYEKGYLLLRALEEHVGRERFDGFLREYLGTYRFRSITTDDFVAMVDKVLPGALAAVGSAAWLDGPGVPANAPVARSARLEAVQRACAAGAAGLDGATTTGWTPVEWGLWLEGVGVLDAAACAALDARFGLTAQKNYEIVAAWLRVAIGAGYAPALERVQTLLGEVGRMKFLRPLYQALARHDLALARRCFERWRGGYHPIAAQVVSGVLAKAAAPAG